MEKTIICFWQNFIEQFVANKHKPKKINIGQIMEYWFKIYVDLIIIDLLTYESFISFRLNLPHLTNFIKFSQF